jgi:hypothetical protein
MQREAWNIRYKAARSLLTLWIVLAIPVPAIGADPVASPKSGRHFATSTFLIDALLARPYGQEVPMGCTGARLWASSPQGWGFRDDVNWLYLSNIKAFDIAIRDQHGLLTPAGATYYPSHVHYEGAARIEMSASASFTFALDRLENPLSKPFTPHKRWTCWSSGRREDWYAVEFSPPRTLSGVKIWFFDDAREGECRPPERVTLEAWRPDQPQPIALLPKVPNRTVEGENVLEFEPIELSKLRLVFQNAGQRYYTGLYGFEPIELPGAARRVAPATPLRIDADKFITASDVLVAILRIHNLTNQVQSISVEPTWDWTSRWTAVFGQSFGAGSAPRIPEPRSVSGEGTRRFHETDLRLRFRYLALDDPPSNFIVRSRTGAGTAAFAGFRALRPPPLVEQPGWPGWYCHHLAPGETKIIKAALEVRPASEVSELDASVNRVNEERGEFIAPARQDPRDVLAEHVMKYQSWFDTSLAYFDCSDPFIRKMYYHRAYVLRKNMLDPKLGRMQWPTQSEGRWRSNWYPNVISYGAGHQVREARWLRDPAYWKGHLCTWAENEKIDGVYPSHVTPAGPSDGQYTDWITSTAWDGHLVHPDAGFLAEVVDKLARNVRGWQKTCDVDGDGLLAVDSHWWTGMEYQPSFFFFSDYKVSGDFSQPARPVNLERVDLTAYNYGNAIAVARIYRRLGKQAKAKEFEDLAAKIAGAVIAKMWRSEKRYFYSLRAEDDAVADVKEVIGVYPFYFGLVPWGRGYESAWASILDPEQFWTPWPVASASRACPAYSQTNWPGDGRTAGCMWNGPTWPHANSLVMTAMARTLRAARDRSIADSPLRKEHLWALFTSFTKAQFRNQDIRQPRTGEYYNGENGAWKTSERDYNHSTWLDILIPELIGLVPREDEIVEIDPLLPEDALSHFVLDGQRYHGHDVTVVWDNPRPASSDRFGDGRKGLDLYIDGKLAASAPNLSKLRVDLAAGERK